MPQVIRPALPADAAAIGQIRVAAWQAAYTPFMPADYLAVLNPAANIESLRLKLENLSPHFYLALIEEAQEVAGFYLLGTPRFECPSHSAELWALNIAPHAWRKGIGKRLVMDAIASARRFSYQNIVLWCIAGNLGARQLYEQCGFRVNGQQKTDSQLTGHPLHEVCYALTLHF
ncbi:GNAT family N-acetyltransferase [Iodobacter sp.]|uniref:GNAT family N-acetyltransferase n=1 Tax=Iodobacter sp. TaxID=1915058 RepID=UPI0025EF73B8|nr:GNAT family N-acetyltransferase [Iodobacter sp.]